jgi:hypothetical protein
MLSLITKTNQGLDAFTMLSLAPLSRLRLILRQVVKESLDTSIPLVVTFAAPARWAQSPHNFVCGFFTSFLKSSMETAPSRLKVGNLQE